MKTKKTDSKKNSMFRESVNYLKSSKRYIIFATLLFLIGLLIGYSFYKQLSFLDEYLARLISEVKGMNAIQLISFIFQNNIQSAFLTLFLGMMLGIIPLVNALLNGVLLGYVFFYASTINGITSIWRILPHGIFELPAILISIGLGMKLGFGILTNYFGRYKGIKNRIIGVLSIIFAVIGLLFVMSSLSSFTNKGLTSSFGAINLIILFLIGLFLITPFVFNFFLLDKRLRKMQKDTFIERFYLSFKVFLTIILPLLIIAAIIEGLLIAFLR